MCVVETIGGWGDRVVGWDQGIRVDWVVLVNVGKYWDLGSVVSDV